MTRSVTARLGIALVALLVVPAAPARAQIATQTLTLGISAINQVAFVGSPTLTVSSAVAGSGPTSVTNATATWAVTTNQTGAKITGSIPANMPTGVTLSTSLAAPLGATSAGFKALTTVAVDLVTSVTKVAQGSMIVTYRLDATSAAGVVANSTRVVTYTITGGT